MQESTTINKTTKQQNICAPEDVKYVNCPLCNESYRNEEILYKEGELGIIQCNNCDLIYVNPAKAHQGFLLDFF